MVRISKVVACMFCGDTPCSCNAKRTVEPKTRTPRKRGVTPVPIVDGAVKEQRGATPSSEIQKAVLTGAIRDSITHRRQDIAEAEEAAAQTEIDWILTDPEMIDAIKAVEPIMHPLEKLRFRRVLSSTGRSVKEKAAAWKGRIVNG